MGQKSRRYQKHSKGPGRTSRNRNAFWISEKIFIVLYTTNSLITAGLIFNIGTKIKINTIFKVTYLYTNKK